MAVIINGCIVLPDLNKLRREVDYDPKTGKMTWRTSRGGCVQIGAEAGYIDKKKGYRKICFDSENYRAETLAWHHFYGEFIEIGDKLIHHVNGDRSDNRICNLALVTRSEYGRLWRGQTLCADPIAVAPSLALCYPGVPLVRGLRAYNPGQAEAG